jgi:hypothetical protein
MASRREARGRGSVRRTGGEQKLHGRTHWHSALRNAEGAICVAGTPLDKQGGRVCSSSFSYPNARTMRRPSTAIWLTRKRHLPFFNYELAYPAPIWELSGAPCVCCQAQAVSRSIASNLSS